MTTGGHDGLHTFFTKNLYCIHVTSCQEGVHHCTAHKCSN